MMKKNLVLVITCILAFMVSIVPADARKNKAFEPDIKYVFYMIGDGMGISSVYGAEIYNRATGNGPENINFNHFPVRTVVTTHSATSLVADSAAAGTALATGHETDKGNVGVNVDGKSVNGLMEWAEDMGFGTGMATSVGINHATPAAFCSHVESRYRYADIVDGYISGGIDFFAGGGIYDDRKLKAEELEKRIADAGITILKGEAVADAGNVGGRLLCLGGGSKPELEYAIDRNENDLSLRDFVDSGIDYLDGRYGDKGFLFVIEGGMIDYAGHSHDLVTAFREVNDFAAAVDLAMAFYNEHPQETLIVITADHETGGLVLGSGNYYMNPERLAWQKESVKALSEKYRDHFACVPLTYDEVRNFLSMNLGLWNHVEVDETFDRQLMATVEDLAGKGGSSSVTDLYSNNEKIVVDAIEYLAKVSGFSWGVPSHSGYPVGLYVCGPGAERFYSCRHNIDIPVKIAEVAGYRVF